MVFQSYALYPRMTVRRNMGFGLRMRAHAAAERERRVDDVASILGLEHLLDRRPAALSGGQRQRVAMGRAIVREPQVFLMDEPLSNLDAKLRVSMRSQLSLLHQRLGVTTVYVTHDQIEAMTLGQRVAVLRDGVCSSATRRRSLFRQPGEPVRRRLHRLAVDELRPRPSSPAGSARSPGGPCRCPAGSSLAGAERKVVLGVRPTAFAVANANGVADDRP